MDNKTFWYFKQNPNFPHCTSHSHNRLITSKDVKIITALSFAEEIKTAIEKEVTYYERITIKKQWRNTKAHIQSKNQ